MDKISNLLFRFLWIKYICWRYFQDKPAKPIKPYSGYTWKYRRTRDYSVLTTQGILGSKDEPEITLYSLFRVYLEVQTNQRLLCTDYSGYIWKYRRTRDDYLYSLLRVYLEVQTNQKWLSVLSTQGIPGSTDEPEMTICTLYSWYTWKYGRTRDDYLYSLLLVFLEVQTNQRWLCTHYSGYIWKYRRTRDDSVLTTQGISGSTDEPEMTLYSLLRVYLEVQMNQRWLCTHYSGYIWNTARRTRDNFVLTTQV